MCRKLSAAATSSSPGDVRPARSDDVHVTTSITTPRGIRTLGGKVETLEVDEPRPLAADEVLIDIRSAGVGNWDDIIRTGGWDVGTSPPLALGVEAAGVITAVGAHPSGFSVDDEVLCHPVPLRDQGTWAPFLIAPVGSLAHKPPELSWETAAIFPVPALTAEQVVGEALAVHGGETPLVNGAGGITGGLIVQSWPPCVGSMCSPPPAPAAPIESAGMAPAKYSTTTIRCGHTAHWRWRRTPSTPSPTPPPAPRVASALPRFTSVPTALNSTA
jgi:Alcohol dehydrogenase GroES-like domain